MNGNIPFVGVGSNPHGVDLPLGLGMLLAQDPHAMAAFGQLTEDKKAALIRHIQTCSTGDEAKTRIQQTVNQLKHGSIT